MKTPSLRFGMKTLLFLFCASGAAAYVFGNSLLAQWRRWNGPSMGSIDFRIQNDGSTPRQWDSLDAMHAYYIKSFVESEGFGGSRIPQITPRDWMLAVDGKLYSVGKLELLSFIHDGEQDVVAYENSWNVLARNSLSGYEQRPLTEFEQRVVDYLRSGGEPVLHHKNLETRLVAPLTASESCLQCHDGEKGDVVGAFSYSLNRVSPAVQSLITDANGVPLP